MSSSSPSELDEEEFGGGFTSSDGLIGTVGPNRAVFCTLWRISLTTRSASSSISFSSSLLTFVLLSEYLLLILSLGFFAFLLRDDFLLFLLFFLDRLPFEESESSSLSSEEEDEDRECLLFLFLLEEERFLFLFLLFLDDDFLFFLSLPVRCHL